MIKILYWYPQLIKCSQYKRKFQQIFPLLLLSSFKKQTISSKIKNHKNSKRLNSVHSSSSSSSLKIVPKKKSLVKPSCNLHLHKSMLRKSQQSRGVHLPFCYRTIHAKILEVSLSTLWHLSPPLSPPLLGRREKIARFIKVPRRRFILYVERWFRDRNRAALSRRSPHAGHC